VRASSRRHSLAGEATQEQLVGRNLVSCFRHSLTIGSSHPRRWQGASTTEYREYSEEKERGQRRGGPADRRRHFRQDPAQRGYNEDPLRREEEASLDVIGDTLGLLLLYPRIHRAQWRSRESLDRLQWRRFKRILGHTYERSPFYRSRWVEAGIHPDDIRNRDDLVRLPLLFRDDLRHPEKLVCSGYRIENMRQSLTSGSTGERTKTLFDRRAWVLSKILLKARARLACGTRPTDRIALLQEGAGDGGRSRLRRAFSRRRSFSIFDPIDRVLAELRDYAPTVLYGFPSYLARLAREDARPTGISRVFTSGELLDGETRRKIETAFGAPVLDVYGCTELKEIAWECVEREGYHINSDWLLVEVQGKDGNEYGEGPLVVTSLYNYGMPIIRYSFGDTGCLIRTGCRCGRGLPLMAPTHGRRVDYFRLADGSELSPYAMTCAVEKVDGVRRYQLVQETLARVVVNVVPEAEMNEIIESEIRKALAGVLPGVSIEVRAMDEVQTEPSGKIRVVRSLLGEAGDSES